MDPIGFALENFDADASWRTKQGGDGGMPIDAKVKLFDGQDVDGPVGLRTALMRYSPQFVRMFVEKMMTYAIGRGLEYTDMPTVRAIARDVEQDDNRFSAIVLGVVRARSSRCETKAADRSASHSLEETTMFVAKKHIPRRTFLRGAGVTLALPLLESMVPALTPTRLTAAAPVRRFVGIWHPHGASPGYWSPLQEGKDFEFSFITKPLEPFRNRVVLISGLDMPEAMATTDEPGGDHARGAVLLSGARPRRNAVSPFLGITDRSAHRQQVRAGHDPLVAAARRRGHRQLRQLQLGLQLRLHQLDFVVVADAAAADAGQPARGVRAAVRRRHERRRAAARSAAQRQHPRRGGRPARGVQDQSRRRRQGARRHLRRQHPRARTAHPDRHGQRGEGAGRRRAVRPARRASTSTSG